MLVTCGAARQTQQLWLPPTCQLPFPEGEAALYILRCRKPGQTCHLQGFNALGCAWSSFFSISGSFPSNFHPIHLSEKTAEQLCSTPWTYGSVILPPTLHNLSDRVRKLLDIKIHLYFSSDSLKQRVIVESCWKQRLMLPHWHLSWQTLSALKINHSHQSWSGYFNSPPFLGRSPPAFTRWKTWILYPTSLLQAFLHLWSILQGAKLPPIK